MIALTSRGTLQGDHEVDAHSYLPSSTATRNETQTRLMYPGRHAFVVYMKFL
ncbi:unnamed protein product [Brassica oleracea var. botrytis]